MKRIFTLTLLFLLAFLPSCQKDETTDAGSTTPASVQQLSSDVANRWFGLSLQFAKTTPGFTPPVAARAFGYLGLALYETCAPGMPGTRSGPFACPSAKWGGQRRAVGRRRRQKTYVQT